MREARSRQTVTSSRLIRLLDIYEEERPRQQTDTSSRLKQTAGVLYMERSVEKQAADIHTDSRLRQTAGVLYMARSVEKQAADREKETEIDYWRYRSNESVEDETADGETVGRV